MKIFVDTAPLIYLCEGTTDYKNRVADQFSLWLQQGAAITSSVLSLMELCIHPLQAGDTKRLHLYEQNMQQLCTEPLLAVYASTAIGAARIRAQYGIHSVDSLQLAAAAEADCTTFYTNDKALKKFKGLDVVLVD